MASAKRIIRIILDWIVAVVEFFLPAKPGQEYLPPISDPVILESALSLADKIKKRELKSQHVVRCFIDRIRAVDPMINAVVYDRYSDALKEAEQIDKLLDSGEAGQLLEKPFLGVPFTGKDSISVKGLPLTCGLVARKGMIAEEDAFPVKQMVDRGGAICIGLTNCPEFCFWFDSDNMIKGRTNNPYDLSRIPGGSTGGGAAVIAYAGSVFGVGGDIGGSIRMPAFFCGIYGHKPTPGIINAAGHFPPIEDDRLPMFTFGPLCRYVEDLIPTFKVMAGEEAERKYLSRVGQPLDFKKVKVYYSLEANDPLCTPVKEDVKNGIIAAVDHFKDLGCKVQEYNIEELEHGMDLYISRYFSTNIAPESEWITDCKGEINVFAELGKKIFGLSNHTLPILIVCLIQKLKGREETPEVLRFREIGNQLKRKFHEVLGEDGIFLFPPHPEVAPKHKTTIPKVTNASVYTGTFNILEVPITSVPLGLNKDGVPLGVQVVAGPFNDHLTLAAALELDKKFRGWAPPCRVYV